MSFHKQKVVKQAWKYFLKVWRLEGISKFVATLSTKKGYAID